MHPNLFNRVADESKILWSPIQHLFARNEFIPFSIFLPLLSIFSFAHSSRYTTSYKMPVSMMFWFPPSSNKTVSFYLSLYFFPFLCNIFSFRYSTQDTFCVFTTFQCSFFPFSSFAMFPILWMFISFVFPLFIGFKSFCCVFYYSSVSIVYAVLSVSGNSICCCFITYKRWITKNQTPITNAYCKFDI